MGKANAGRVDKRELFGLLRHIYWIDIVREFPMLTDEQMAQRIEAQLTREFHGYLEEYLDEHKT